MGNLKKITLEIPESTYLMDIVYYWKNKNGTVKAVGTYSEESLTDENVIQAWSNRYTQTEEKED